MKDQMKTTEKKLRQIFSNLESSYRSLREMETNLTQWEYVLLCDRLYQCKETVMSVLGRIEKDDEIKKTNDENRRKRMKNEKFKTR